MHIPVFGKTIAFANFSSIAIAVSAVMPFYKRRVNRITYRRGFCRGLNLSLAAKDCSQFNPNPDEPERKRVR